MGREAGGEGFQCCNFCWDTACTGTVLGAEGAYMEPAQCSVRLLLSSVYFACDFLLRPRRPRQSSLPSMLGLGTLRVSAEG